MYKLYTDGACRGNGSSLSESAIGCVLEKDFETVVEISEYVGVGYTNNESEYMALIRGVRECLDRGVCVLDIYVDSKLVAEQVKGNYKINKNNLKKLCMEVRELLGRLDIYTIQNIPRRYNKRADQLANDAFANKKTSNMGNTFGSIKDYLC